ncbi:MAG TPA: hypothetical protein VGI61_07430, partial [Parafilimonas sp.]
IQSCNIVNSGLEQCLLHYNNQNMNLPDIPEYVANYFNFITDFAADPKNACNEYRASNSINKNLLSFAAIGIVFTWITISLLKKIAESNNDKSDILKIADKVDADTAALIILPCIIIISLLVHLAVKLIFFLNMKIHKRKTAGAINLKNTINGSLAFFSFAPFVFMLCFLFIMLVCYKFQNHLNLAGFLLILSPLIILQLFFAFWYFPASLSAMQPDELSGSYRKAIYSVYGLIFVLIAMQDWLYDLFN